MRLFNTASGCLEEVSTSGRIRMYVCGITPYAAAHIGHAMVYLTYDLLVRRLRDRGQQVTYVRNVTDIDDTILEYAHQHGRDYLQLGKSEESRFATEMAQLGILAPDHEPHATQTIASTVELIRELIERGSTYVNNGDIYFNTAAFASFGNLSSYPSALLEVLNRTRGGNPAKQGKRHPLDFLLWQMSRRGEPKWDTRLGAGRPGWHVGCAAMSVSTLGPSIDIHGGGTDLVFPHHECKRAVVESITSNVFVKQWVHTGVVTYAGEKMSKSLGNLVFVGDVLSSCEPMVLRLALMSRHYRGGFEWHRSMLEPAKRLLCKLRSAVGREAGPDPRPCINAIRAALDDDLDAPRALSVVADLADSIRQGGTDRTSSEGLITCCNILGIDLATSQLDQSARS